MMFAATSLPPGWKFIAAALVIAVLCSLCLVAWLVWPASKDKSDRRDP